MGERAAAAEALILGTKKKKTKRTKKTQNATNITPASGVHEKKSTKKDLPPSTDCAKDSCSEVKVQSTQSQGMHAQKHAQNGPIPTDFASSNSSNNTDQGEQYRQHQLLLHQQHQDQLRQQLQIQHRQHQDQLRQQLQRQQQEEMYRQHHQHQQQMQREELYRQHLRQQEILQAAQQQQNQQQQRQRQQQQLQQHHSTNPQFRDHQ